MTNKKGRTMATTNTLFISNYNSPTYDFAVAIERAIGVVIDPIADSKIHRFDDPKGRSGNKVCWYILHHDGIAAGAYGNWRTDLSEKWCAGSNRNLTSAEKQRINSLVAIAQKTRQQDRATAQTQAEHRASTMWRAAHPAITTHPYLARKNVCALGLRQMNSTLLIPIYDATKKLVNIQTISESGDKRFLKGGRVSGCYFLAGSQTLPHSGTLYICEGVATGLTLWQQLRTPIVCALNAGNLNPVCETLSKNHPQLVLIIAADNDHSTHGNPGITKASQAAKSVGAGITWPLSCGDNCTCTDFNDQTNCMNRLEDAS